MKSRCTKTIDPWEPPHAFSKEIAGWGWADGPCRNFRSPSWPALYVHHPCSLLVPVKHFYVIYFISMTGCHLLVKWHTGKSWKSFRPEKKKGCIFRNGFRETITSIGPHTSKMLVSAVQYITIKLVTGVGHQSCFPSPARPMLSPLDDTNGIGLCA